MKDYSLTEEEKKTYVTKVIKQRNGKLKIVYADGRVAKDINCTDNIIKAVEDRQEQQVWDALKRYEEKDKIEIKTSGFDTAFCTMYESLYGTLISIGICSGINIKNVNDALIVTGACVGTFVIVGSVIDAIQIKTMKEELNKLRYRNDHEDELKRLREYRNALVGIKEKKRRQIESRNNPFSVLYVDDYSENDLRTIVANINQEDNKEKVKSR